MTKKMKQSNDQIQWGDTDHNVIQYIHHGEVVAEQSLTDGQWKSYKLMQNPLEAAQVNLWLWQYRALRLDKPVRVKFPPLAIHFIDLTKASVDENK